MSSEAGTVSIALMGDIMLDRTIGERFRSEPEAFELPAIRELLEGHDIVFANLENPVARGGAPNPVQDPNVCFRADPDSLRVLENLGVTVVSLGNNHMLDYGAEGLLETIDHLDARGILHAGAGATLEEADRPARWEVRGRDFALLSHSFVFSASTERATATSPGVADYRVRPILRRIRELSRAGATVLVSLHWGIEYQWHPLAYQRRWAQRMIEAGASLIIGHGPHFPQGVEDYRGGRIVYSLGNFIFDEPFKWANRTFIHSVEVDRAGVPAGGRVVPVVLRDGLPEPAEGATARTIGGLVKALSRRHARNDRSTRLRMNNLWFTDIVWRIETMHSWKFLRLPPLAFYLSLGWKGYLRRVLPRSLRRRLPLEP